jgi:hypothetical protein
MLLCVWSPISSSTVNRKYTPLSMICYVEKLLHMFVRSNKLLKF